MPSRAPVIARIRLARTPWRLYSVPALLVLGAVALAALAVVEPIAMAAPVRWAALGGTALLALVGVLVAAWLLSIRLDVEEAAVRLRWLGGERVYVLTPGQVTRVKLRGRDAARLRTRTGWFGWGLGRGRLRGEEDVEVVRLARTATVILVPTARGRLAVAPASEEELVSALTAAARARERLDEPARRSEEAPPDPAPPDPAPPSQPAEAPPPIPRPAAEPEAEPGPRVLTGIERAMLEERLARERELAAAAASQEPTEVREPSAAAGVGAAGPGAGAAAPPNPAAIGAPAARPTRLERVRIGGRAAKHLGRPRPTVAFVFVPLVGAGIVWGVAFLLGRLPEPQTDLGRLTALALVLAGPATSVGAIMALAWWPRIVGVVVTSGLAASVFVGRALLGA